MTKKNKRRTVTTKLELGQKRPSFKESLNRGQREYDKDTEDRREAPRGVNKFEDELMQARREGIEEGWQRAGKHFQSVLDIQKNDRAADNACLSISGEEVRIRSLSDNDLRTYANHWADDITELEANRIKLERRLIIKVREINGMRAEVRFRGMEMSKVSSNLTSPGSDYQDKQVENLKDANWETGRFSAGVGSAQVRNK